MIDVQIVAFGDEDLLRRALRALPRALVESVLVVDHKGNLPEEMVELADVLITDRSNPGFGAGHNRLLREGTAPYVLLLNPDAELREQALEQGVELLEAHPRAAAVQGAISDRSTGEDERSHGMELRPVHLWGRALGLRRLLRLRLTRRLARAVPVLVDHIDRRPLVPTEVESLAATALLARREALEQVGGFDERYFMYGEDLDLCRRLRAQGWILLAAPFPFARHDGGASSAGWRQRELLWWQGTLGFAAMWWSGAALRSARMATAIMAVRVGWREGPRGVRQAWTAMTQAVG